MMRNSVTESKNERARKFQSGKTNVLAQKILFWFESAFVLVCAAAFCVGLSVTALSAASKPSQIAESDGEEIHFKRELHSQTEKSYLETASYNAPSGQEELALQDAKADTLRSVPSYFTESL